MMRFQWVTFLSALAVAASTPVQAGFTINTDYCAGYSINGALALWAHPEAYFSQGDEPGWGNEGDHDGDGQPEDVPSCAQLLDAYNGRAIPTGTVSNAGVAGHAVGCTATASVPNLLEGNLVGMRSDQGQIPATDPEEDTPSGGPIIAPSADLRCARAWRVHAECANFSGIDLRGAEYNGGTFDGASFHNAALERADFRAADLRGANFMDAYLKGASFNSVTKLPCDWGSTQAAREAEAVRRGMVDEEAPVHLLAATAVRDANRGLTALHDLSAPGQLPTTPIGDNDANQHSGGPGMVPNGGSIAVLRAL
ncbi:MAG TPA: pentapeptide repeat-containing protein [Bdellovibrionota bacterium]|nr:pentapeptide repeat-containing protein [Bdellovibrionota bacterium]